MRSYRNLEPFPLIKILLKESNESQHIAADFFEQEMLGFLIC